MGRRKSTDGGEPISLRVSDKLMAKLTHATEQLGKPLSEVMRDAMELGLRDLQEIGYDTIGAIAAAAKASRAKRQTNEEEQQEPAQEEKPEALPVKSGPKSSIVKAAGLFGHITPQSERAAEEPGEAGDQSSPKKTTYPSGRRKAK